MSQHYMDMEMSDFVGLKVQKKWISLERGDFLSVLLLLPTIFIVLIVMIIPIVYGLYLSLFQYKVGGDLNAGNFIGFENYIKLLNDALVWKSTKTTILFAFFATGGDLIFGTVVAVLLMKVRRGINGILRAVFLIPLLVSPIIIGLIWKFLFDPANGTIYWILSWFGLGIKEFPGVTGYSTALLCVIIAHWWQVIPFVMLVVTAGLVSVPIDLYEAAGLDGAGGFRKFFSISLPHLFEVYMVILVISGVDTLKVFDIIYSLTGGGPANETRSLSMYAYQTAFKSNNMGYAMAVSIFTMCITFIIFGIPFIRFNRKKD